MTARQVLIYLWKAEKGDWNRIYQDIKEKKPLDREEVEKTDVEGYVTLVDDNYPKTLTHMSKPPFVLRYKGSFLAHGRARLYYARNFIEVEDGKLLVVTNNSHELAQIYVALIEKVEIPQDAIKHKDFYNDVVTLAAEVGKDVIVDLDDVDEFRRGLVADGAGVK